MEELIDFRMVDLGGRGGEVSEFLSGIVLVPVSRSARDGNKGSTGY
jgi:hypothetical protein